MSPSNDLINEWLKVAEASPGPRFLTFATLAAEWGAKQEREACAKVCEDEAAFFRCQKEGCRDARYDWKKDAAMECSLAIRKRGEGKP